MSPVNAPAAERLSLRGELNIYRAAELKAQLLAALDGAPALELDLSGVTEIDSAGVQLLMLARRSALARQRALRLVGHSAAVNDVFQLLDLHAYFGDPLPTPAGA
ncbi:STAS domain-containing protein [Ideonella sp. BN130291]|uniref:STAS domain-containing protein n=1 Tax=Ideonella sp. BN130291 TaxID=3112940 RepID=UPI002E255783|nr:STAS domain-containing protein [Ideonella sp. BN130291]